MKSKKKYKDLKQLDRIECLLQHKYLEDRYSLTIVNDVWFFCQVLFMWMVLAILMYDVFDSYTLILKSESFMVLIKTVFYICIGFNIYLLIMGIYKKRKLKKQFNLK